MELTHEQLEAIAKAGFDARNKPDRYALEWNDIHESARQEYRRMVLAILAAYEAGRTGAGGDNQLVLDLSMLVRRLCRQLSTANDSRPDTAKMTVLLSPPADVLEAMQRIARWKAGEAMIEVWPIIDAHLRPDQWYTPDDQRKDDFKDVAVWASLSLLPAKEES